MGCGTDNADGRRTGHREVVGVPLRLARPLPSAAEGFQLSPSGAGMIALVLQSRLFRRTSRDAKLRLFEDDRFGLPSRIVTVAGRSNVWNTRLNVTVQRSFVCWR